MVTAVERELTAPVDLIHPDGRLRPEAHGWARHPLQRCNIPRTMARAARWDYWCVTSRTSALTLLVADVGYAGVVLVSFLDFAARAPVERVYVRPRGLPSPMPTSPRGDFAIDVARLRLSMRMVGDALHVVGRARPLLGPPLEVDLVIDRPASHETLNVLVPWDETHFQFTSKQQALPARGVVKVGAREHRFGPDNQGFACMDFGCGRWPRRIEWDWAFASTRAGDHTIGLNLGGRWTEGTGVTENGVVIDGRIHKVSEAVDFDYDRRDFMRPWRIRTRSGGRVDLRFEPIRERAVKVPLGLLAVEVHQMMGRFTGAVVDDHGHRVALDDVVGLAESVRGRW